MQKNFLPKIQSLWKFTHSIIKYTSYQFQARKFKIFHFFRYARHRWSYSYVTYYCMWFRLFATALVPLAALTYCNAKILIYYRNNNFTRAHTVMRRMRTNNESVDHQHIRPQELRLQLLSSRVQTTTRAKNILKGTENGQITSPIIESHNRTSSSHKTSRERTLFVMLCCITLTFFFCHLPR